MNDFPNPDGGLRILARDGYPLAASLYTPDAERRGIVIVSSATAVPRRFYRRFAVVLAGAGYAVITYDYRGIGDSAPRSLKGFECRTRDWGLLDMAGVIDWARDELAAEKLFLVGHSVGGQVAGLLDNAERVDGLVTVSAQSGYWALQGGEQKWLAGFHMYFTFPVLTRIVGYMPWSWLGNALDIPKGAALEWSRWCRDPDYLLGDETLPLDRFATFGAPVLAYSIGDDKWGTVAAVNAMMSAYPNVERRHIEPGDHGMTAIGHFGYFRPGSEPLWHAAIGWLDQRAS